MFPIITYPYALRVIGVEHLGQVSYVVSFIDYFTLFATFGVTTYAIRECAAVRDDKDRFGDLASRLWSFNICSVAISLILLVLFALLYPKLHSYVPLIVILGLSIVFAPLSADWVAVAYEDYTYITVRGIIISTLNMVALFIFVKSPDDYLIYAFLHISATVVGGIVNMIYLRRYTRLRFSVSRRTFDFLPALKPFFVNELSVAVYVGADVFILGSIKNDYFVGIYSVAVKIYTIVKSIFIAIFSVTISRLSAHASKGEMDEFGNIISKVTSVFIILGFPAVTGILLYAGPIVYIVGGSGYERSKYSLMLLAVALLFAIFGGIAANCINVPLGFEKVNSRATLIAAVENTVLNIPFIILWNEIGAAISTIIAELTVLLIYIMNLRKNKVGWGSMVVLKDVRDAVIGVLFIAVIRIVIFYGANGSFVADLLGMALSVAGYFALLLLLKNAVVMDGVNAVVKKIKK